MSKKKNSSVFTISLDPYSLQGIKAIRMLDMVGQRKKGVLITEALNYYNEHVNRFDLSDVTPIPISERVVVSTPKSKVKTVNEEVEEISLIVSENTYDEDFVETIDEDGFIDEEDASEELEDDGAFDDALNMWDSM